MLDLNLIRENPKKIEAALAKKECHVDMSIVLKMDEDRRKLLHEIEENQAAQNRLSKEFPKYKDDPFKKEEIKKQVSELKIAIEEKRSDLEMLEKKIYDFLIVLPNIPDDDLLPGEKENNQVIDVRGVKPSFNFKVLDHVTLEENLGLIDYERGVKVAGHGNWFYTGDGARLEWALLNFFIQEHLKDGYKFILSPLLLNLESGLVSGQFPKFQNDVFLIENVEPHKFLLPTAETSLVNYYRGEILNEDDLPQKFFAYTPCFRKEAGSYRSVERGTIRGYQFNKVEMVQYTTEKDSDRAFEELLNKAKSLMDKLGLHYRVSKLAAADCSASMARTYDIEVYFPSLDIYKEVSSVSNARDYQARRGKMRYKDKATGQNKFMHTLNGSGLATSRVFPAILEQYQQADGSVKIPEVLCPFMNGEEYIFPKKK